MPRFAMPKAPCDFEVPDDWWAEAGMVRFKAVANCYMYAAETKSATGAAA